jgi:hypothetical protein
MIVACIADKCIEIATCADFEILLAVNELKQGGYTT